MEQQVFSQPPKTNKVYRRQDHILLSRNFRMRKTRFARIEKMLDIVCDAYPRVVTLNRLSSELGVAKQTVKQDLKDYAAFFIIARRYEYIGVARTLMANGMEPDNSEEFNFLPSKFERAFWQRMRS